MLTSPNRNTERTCSNNRNKVFIVVVVVIINIIVVVVIIFVIVVAVIVVIITDAGNKGPLSAKNPKRLASDTYRLH